MLKIHPRYLLLAILLFAVEVLIAMYVHDAIIRPYIGDLLVVVLLYCLVKAFLDIPVWKAAIGVLLFSFFIEAMQYFKLVQLLGLQGSKLARIVIGTSFSWWDILAYTMGIGLVFFLEKIFKKK